MESHDWVMSLSPSGGGEDLWQGHACTISVSHWVDVAAHLQGLSQVVIQGCPVTFRLILRDTHVHVFCGGNGGDKNTGCP